MNILAGIGNFLGTIVGIGIGIVLVLCFGTVKSYLVSLAKNRALKAAKDEMSGYSGDNPLLKTICDSKLGGCVENTYTKSSFLAKLKYDLQPVKMVTSSVRLILVAIAVAGAVYAYGYWKGTSNAPVKFDMRGKAALIRLNEHYLNITPDGSAYVLDKDKRVLKQVRVSDIPALEKALKPYGLDIKPFAFVGGGVGEKSAWEVGAGLQLIKYYRWYLNAFLTQKGAYIGPSYRVTENADIQLGVGKGYKGDNRVNLGIKLRF